MLFSVVIPSYNHERYIGEAIRSVLDQDGPDVEIVVVDDGSTDDSVSRIESALDKAPKNRAVFHRQENAGAHAAIEKGIALSSGDCILLLNSDDFYHRDRIRKISERVSRTSNFIVFTGVDFVGPNSSSIPEHHAHWQWYRKMEDEAEQAPTVGLALLQNNLSVSSGNLAFSRSLYESLGGFSDFLFCHDWDFLLRASRWVEPIRIDAPLLFYRVHPDNSTHSLRDIQENEVRAALNGFLRRCREEGTPNPAAPCPENWPSFFEPFVKDSSFHFDERPIADFIETGAR